MQLDEATKTWLKKELVNALGFSEVDDIVFYITSTFNTKEEIEPYLTELLGIAQSRAAAISARLLGSKPKKERHISNLSAAATPFSASSGLVPVPAAPNSRIKQTKSKKTTNVLSSQIINCLRCGKIEYNGGRKCLFCDTELRYEELSPEEIDQTAQAHMEKLVLFDQTSAERTTVIDTEEFFYDEQDVTKDENGNRKRQIQLSLDVEKKQFVMTPNDNSNAPLNGGIGHISRNQDLTKEARELYESIQRTLEKQQATEKKAREGALNTVEQCHEQSNAVVDEEYNLLYV